MSGGSTCDDNRFSIGAYVLGALDPAEAEAVRRHVDGCPGCAAELRKLAPLPGLLRLAGRAEAAAAEPLPPAFEERLLDAFARDRAAPPPPRRGRRLRLARPRWLAAGAAAAAFAAAGAALVIAPGEDDAHGYEVVLRPAPAAAGAKAWVELESGAEGTTLHLWVRDLPGDPRAIYEVLCEAPGWRASAGTFRVDRTGRAYVVLTTAARRGEYDAIRVVRRTPAGDGRTVTRNVLSARLS